MHAIMHASNVSPLFLKPRECNVATINNSMIRNLPTEELHPFQCLFVNSNKFKWIERSTNVKLSGCWFAANGHDFWLILLVPKL